MQPLIIIAVLLLAASTIGRAESLPTDANLVAAIDISGSVDPAAEALQFEGIAAAVRHPAFLQTVAAGFHHRIGFAVFAWSSHGHFLTLVPWTAIDSPATAAKVAAQLHKVRPMSRQFPPVIAGAEPRPWRRDLLTDVSAMIEHSSELLARAPFASARDVVNILANGTDNVAEGPDAARARAISRGVVINGLVLGGDAEVVSYFRERVRCGAGSFVLATHEPDDIAWAMLQKFLLDLAARRSDPVGWSPLLEPGRPPAETPPDGPAGPAGTPRPIDTPDLSISRQDLALLDRCSLL